jgi:hypothetical protein
MSFLSKDAINVWSVEVLTKNHIHIEDDKHSLMGHFKNSIKIEYFND